jgi:hypothetical protein
MSRYLAIWEPNLSRWPTDPNEAAKLRSESREWVNQNISKGLITSWGAFMNGSKGYAVFEGNAPDVYKEAHKFDPYYIIDLHEVLSVDELREP